MKREREREKEVTEIKRERKRENERERVFFYVSVWETGSSPLTTVYFRARAFGGASARA